MRNLQEEKANAFRTGTGAGCRVVVRRTDCRLDSNPPRYGPSLDGVMPSPEYAEPLPGVAPSPGVLAKSSGPGVAPNPGVAPSPKPPLPGVSPIPRPPLAGVSSIHSPPSAGVPRPARPIPFVSSSRGVPPSAPSSAPITCRNSSNSSGAATYSTSTSSIWRTTTISSIWRIVSVWDGQVTYMHIVIGLPGKACWSALESQCVQKFWSLISELAFQNFSLAMVIILRHGRRCRRPAKLRESQSLWGLH